MVLKVQRVMGDGIAMIIISTIYRLAGTGVAEVTGAGNGRTGIDPVTATVVFQNGPITDVEDSWMTMPMRRVRMTFGMMVDAIRSDLIYPRVPPGTARRTVRTASGKKHEQRHGVTKKAAKVVPGEISREIWYTT